STATPYGRLSPAAPRGRGLAATYGLPAWVTVRVSPAIVSVPLRVAPGLASKLNVARPSPVPVAVVCSHGALAVADQAPLVRTRSDALPAVGPSSSAVVPSWLGVRRSSSTSRAGRKRGGGWRGRWGARRGVRANSIRIQERGGMGNLLPGK